MLKEAPIAFILTLIVGCFLSFAVVSWHYNGQIDILKDSLDNYRIKLEGMTPDEAQKRIETLESQLKEKGSETGVVNICMLPGLPVGVMEPPQENSFLDEMQTIIQNKKIDRRDLLQLSYECEKTRIKLTSSQKFINDVWKENKQ